MIQYLLSLEAAKLKLFAVSFIAGIAITSLVAISVYVSSLKKDVETLTNENNRLTTNNKILQANIDVMADNIKRLSDANAVNLATIQKLKNERKDAQAAIDSLAAANQNSKKEIGQLNKKLDDMLKDPKSDGELSPSLKETVRNVQQSRKSK